ncbi:ubiquitin carboxyl-terminal hydrolase MINDY-1 isoform X2 [Patagioenas fasciata]|uniref:ubiquitin carboxyl-terminal hydrolase MINDY-1 isoform X2 n=1 Tax=Patagioenas fasciata TaxID=372321 RepID=UPI0032E8A6D0
MDPAHPQGPDPEGPMEPPPEQDRGTSWDKGTPQPPGEVGGGSEVPPPPAVGLDGCAPHPPPNEHPQDDAPEPQSAEDGVSPAGPRAATGGVTAPAEPPPARPPARDAEEDFYCVKWIEWKGERTPVITQSANGPCPLLALMNVLLLRWKVKLPPQKEVITAEELMAHLGDCILSTPPPREPAEGLQLNFQQNINDSMTVLPKLSTGLDVNVRFTGVSDFEYTPECIVFDLLSVPLYHGWLLDPQSPELVRAVGKLSYNQLVEKIITCKQASDSGLLSEGLVAEQFLEATASQLTEHGLCELAAAVPEGELSVFFRNNHFSTMTKHKGHLYLLVTDQGFLREDGVVWETLQSVDGDSCFCDTEFRPGHAHGGAAAAPPGHRLQQRQVDQDYMIALSLQQGGGQDPSVLSDLELARQLQQEEYQQQQQQQQQQHQRPQHPQHPHPQHQGPAQARAPRRQRQKPDLDCALL